MKGESIQYEFSSSSVGKFVRHNNFLDILPPLCNADFAIMEVSINGDRDLVQYEEYVDLKEYRRKI